MLEGPIDGAGVDVGFGAKPLRRVEMVGAARRFGLASGGWEQERYPRAGPCGKSAGG